MTRALAATVFVALGGLVAIGAFLAAPAVEDDVADRVAVTLAQLPEVTVEVDGRDVDLAGPLPAGVSTQQVLDAINSMDAVRSVTDGGLVEALAPATTAQPTPSPVLVADASLSIVVGADTTELSGAVFDGTQLADLLAAVERTAPTVVSRVVVDDREPTVEAVAQVAAIVGFLSDVGADIGTGTVTLVEGELVVATSVRDDASRDRVTDLARATGLDSQVTLDIAEDGE